jgi:hypothetical protein
MRAVAVALFVIVGAAPQAKLPMCPVYSDVNQLEFYPISGASQMVCEQASIICRLSAFSEARAYMRDVPSLGDSDLNLKAYQNTMNMYVELCMAERGYRRDVGMTTPSEENPFELGR